MTGMGTLLFLKVLCDIERKKNETIASGSQEENVTAAENSPCSQTPFKIYMQEKHGVGGSLGSKRYACHKCSCLFRWKRHLRRHLKVHCSHKCLGCSECAAEINKCYHNLLGKTNKSPRQFPCSSCASTFHTQAGLAIHEEFHPQPGKLFQCDSCSEQFVNRWDLDHHQKIHITSEVFKCTSCIKAFTTPSSLAKHRKSRHEKREEEFGTHFLASFNATTEEHDLSMKFACEFCDVDCSDDTELKNHVSRHFSDGNIRCLECSKRFQTKQELSKHMQIHRLPVGQEVPGKKRSKAAEEDTASTTHEQDEQDTKCFKWSNGDICEAYQEEKLDEDDKTCNLCLQRFRYFFYNSIHICRNFPSMEDINEKALEENNFQCPACSKKFTGILPLKLHFSVHKGEDPQHCSVCDRRYSSVSKLDNHFECHGRNTCMKCGIFFNTRLALLLHDCGFTQPVFTCLECGQEFPSKFSYKKHGLTHPTQKQPQYQCSECKRIFLKESNFRAHRIRHTGTHPFSCSLCADKFLTYGAFRAHSIEHLNDKIIQCEECDSVFTSQLKFRYHLKMHEKEREDAVVKAEENENERLIKSRPKYEPLKAQECDLCGIVFLRKIHLMTHKKEVHNEIPAYPFTCHLCARGFYFKPNCERHFEVCSLRSDVERKKCIEERERAEKRKRAATSGPFSCSVCEKVYTTEKGLSTHMYVHRDASESPYQCSLCGLGFVKKYYKIYHETKCKGESGVLKCKICGSIFKSVRTYNKHNRGHARELSCNVCGEKFITKLGLSRHQTVCTPESFNARILSREKKDNLLSCTKCPRTFTVRSRFLVHLESHEGIAPFECKPCKKKFLSKTNLTRHKCKVGADLPAVKVESQS